MVWVSLAIVLVGLVISTRSLFKFRSNSHEQAVKN
ncbi:MAG: hypothetical protein ACI89Z_001415 [Porticoccus sp.]|jgi:hypothetical protein